MKDERVADDFRRKQPENDGNRRSYGRRSTEEDEFNDDEIRRERRLIAGEERA